MFTSFPRLSVKLQGEYQLLSQIKDHFQNLNMKVISKKVVLKRPKKLIPLVILQFLKLLISFIVIDSIIDSLMS